MRSITCHSSEKYKVYIDAPDGVEAYLDGSYVGVTPVSFNKEPGSHVVTLRKSGYQTRSYTLQIDEGGKGRKLFIYRPHQNRRIEKFMTK